MTGLREWYEDLEPWQRGVIVALAIAVTILLVVLVVALAVGGDPPPATSTTTPATTVPEATTTTVPETTTTTVPETTTTTPPPTTTVPETTTTTDPLETLVLEPDGIGEVAFGTRAGEALELLSEVLGDPDDDTGWVDREEGYESCLGDRVRFVRWGSLQVFLTDGGTDWAPAGERHFAAYAHGSSVGEPVLPLDTEAGVEIGTRVDSLRRVYGDRVVVDDDPLVGPVWRLEVEGAGFIEGTLSGLDAADVVETISAGVSCGE